jgi:hypothetical protein
MSDIYVKCVKVDLDTRTYTTGKVYQGYRGSYPTHVIIEDDLGHERVLRFETATARWCLGTQGPGFDSVPLWAYFEMMPVGRGD